MGRLYAAYFAATIVLVLTPGATTAVVVRNTLQFGHRAGVRAATGAAVANTMHATLAGLGLWALVGRWPPAIDALRLGGAAYLAWLGLRSVSRLWPHRAAPLAPVTSVQESAPPGWRRDPSSRSSFGEGLAINILNPAIISFYLAVVPTFVPAAPPPGYFTLLAATHIVLAFICHAGWATAFHGLRRVFARPLVRVVLEIGTAVALFWLSARVLGRM